MLESIGYVAQELKKRLPGVPVVPSLGNYDFVPMHSDPGPPLNSWLLHPAADMFSEWLPSEALDTFKYAGYYEVRRNPHSTCTDPPRGALCAIELPQVP